MQAMKRLFNFFLKTGKLLLVLTLINSVVHAQETIRFKHVGYEDFIQEAKISGKPVMIYFTGTGCALCVKMERQVFPQPEIYELFNNSFINVESFDDFRKPDSSIKRLRAKYGVISQPTFIFIDAYGEVIHKSGYKDKADFLQIGKQALGNDNYRGWLEQFNQGAYQTEVVQKFLSVEQSPILYAEEDYRCKAQEVLNKYFASINPSEYTLPENWNIISKYVANPYSDIFNYLLKNQPIFEKKYGQEAVNKKIYSVYKAAWSGNTNSAAYKNVQQTIQGSAHPMAKLLIQIRKLGEESSSIEREKKTDWKDFILKYDETIRKYSNFIEPYWIYSITEDMTTRSPTDLKSISNANLWMKDILKHPENEDEDYYSAYAKTFYLLGNKISAIEMQKKAVEIATQHKVEQKYLDEYKAQLNEYSK